MRRAVGVYERIIRRFTAQDTDYQLLLSTFAEGLYTEMDFRNEALNMERMTTLLEQSEFGSKGVIIPKPVMDRTTRLALVSILQLSSSLCNLNTECMMMLLQQLEFGRKGVIIPIVVMDRSMGYKLSLLPPACKRPVSLLCNLHMESLHDHGPGAVRVWQQGQYHHLKIVMRRTTRSGLTERPSTDDSCWPNAPITVAQLRPCIRAKLKCLIASVRNKL